jgi:hypothetical protein
MDITIAANGEWDARTLGAACTSVDKLGVMIIIVK